MVVALNSPSNHSMRQSEPASGRQQFSAITNAGLAGEVDKESRFKDLDAAVRPAQVAVDYRSERAAASGYRELLKML
jgi:hypothetical protein